MNLIALRTLLVFFLIRASVAFAQAPASTPAVTPQAKPLTAHSRMLYMGAQMILLRSAEKMPEERYAFKPAETVRSFGQIVGHVADAQYLF